jgi:sugar lactone lactonase YvrE
VTLALVVLSTAPAVLAGVVVALARQGGDGGDTAAGPDAGGARFARPVGVAVDADGVVYVSESEYGASRVIAIGGGTDLTVAGGDGGDRDGIPAPVATLAAPHGIAILDGRLYIADRDHARVRSVSADGTIGTVAGTGRVGPLGDLGPAIGARLWQPTGVAVGPDGSLFIADVAGHRVRRVDPGGTISTVAGSGAPGFGGDGGPAIEAGLSGPSGVAVGADGSLYIADRDNDRVRRVDPGGMISTVAGSGTPGFGGDGGPAVAAALASPAAVAVGPDGSLYVADTGNHRIRRVGADGVIGTVAGDGRARSGGDGLPAVQASLNAPAGLCVAAGGELYVADTGNGLVRRVDAGGTITSL